MCSFSICSAVTVWQPSLVAQCAFFLLSSMGITQISCVQLASEGNILTYALQQQGITITLAAYNSFGSIYVITPSIILDGQTVNNGGN
jgi:hypothetical protein